MAAFEPAASRNAAPPRRNPQAAGAQRRPRRRRFAHDKAARFHRRYRGLAADRWGATAGDAGLGLPQPWLFAEYHSIIGGWWTRRALHGRVPPGPRGSRLRRGPVGADRRPLGR